MKEYTWLSVSLFCNKNNWGKLISDGIAGFVTSMPGLMTYTIEFNYLSGENIRLALLVSKGDESTVIQTADKYFKDYFLIANLSARPVKPPFVGVFMPFPANTIQYGLYKTQAITADDIEKYQVAIDLSAIVLIALQDEIDDETVITFAFYLQMGLVKSLMKYLSSVTELSSIIGGFKTEGNYSYDDITSGYEIMDEITGDVMQTDEFEPELDWMNAWIGQCEKALQLSLDTDDRINALKQFYFTRVGAISRLLGLNADSRKLLGRLIDRSSNQFFIINMVNFPYGTN